MFLLVQPSAAKYRRSSYRFLGKQKTLALGIYPTVTLRRRRVGRACSVCFVSLSI